MTEIRVQLDRDLHRRLRQHARLTGTTVPRLVSQVVTGASALLPVYSPALAITRLNRVAGLLDEGLSHDAIAEALKVPAEEVLASVRQLEQWHHDLGDPS